MASTVNTEEIRRFSALAATWWEADGAMRPLHMLNPARLEYINQRIKANFGKVKPRILDLGCGAGLVTEPLAEKGFDVTGVDASADVIEAAKAHAATKNIAVKYQHGTAEELVKKKNTFDVVLALEIIEHTANPAAFVQLCRRLLKPNGVVIFSTLNRTPKSFALGIVAAEYVVGWVPRGTHDWRAFLKPSELANMAEEAGLTVQNICGLTYHPRGDHFALKADDVSVNYFMTAKAQ
jgi:2-polyprenyl-6-hydroxyphenyl methylase/3-demethylubiquinone-9 3-methyltransferase